MNTCSESFLKKRRNQENGRAKVTKTFHPPKL